MSTPSSEQAFYDAVLAAESVRQSAKASAQAAYGFVKLPRLCDRAGGGGHGLFDIGCLGGDRWRA
jgi:hypothetical protein